ncbi:MAG: hypothetical protein ACXVP0_17115, partial [Bacteroidia bacterium]
DTIIGATVKPGPYNTFTGTTSTRTFVKGKDETFAFTLTGTPLVTNPTSPPAIGTAVVTGSLFINLIKQTGPTTFAPAPYVLPNYPVTLKFDKDPTTQMIRTYSAMTDANGVYTFTVQTTDISNAGLGFPNQTGTVYAPDYITTQDTIKTGNIRVTGKPGVFGNTSSAGAVGLYSTEIRNQVNTSYTMFTPN